MVEVKSRGGKGRGRGTHQIENRYFHHTLVKVCRPVLDDLDSHNLLGLQVLAFYHLAEGTLSEDVEDEVAIPTRRGGQQLREGRLALAACPYLCPASSDPRMSLTYRM